MRKLSFDISKTAGPITSIFCKKKMFKEIVHLRKMRIFYLVLNKILVLTYQNAKKKNTKKNLFQFEVFRGLALRFRLYRRWRIIP